MKYRYKIYRNERSITQQVNDWLLERGLDQVSCDKGMAKYDWCGRFAAQVSTTPHGACRLELAEWVVDELINCDGFFQVGQVTVIRERAGLRQITPVINNVFYARAKALRRFKWRNDERFTEFSNSIQSIIRHEPMPEVLRKKLEQELSEARASWRRTFVRLCTQYQKLPPPSRKVKSLQFYQYWQR